MPVYRVAVPSQILSEQHPLLTMSRGAGAKRIAKRSDRHTIVVMQGGNTFYAHYSPAGQLTWQGEDHDLDIEDMVDMLDIDILVDRVRPNTVSSRLPSTLVAVPTEEDRPTWDGARLVRLSEDWIGLYVDGELRWEDHPPSVDELIAVIQQETSLNVECDVQYIANDESLFRRMPRNVADVPHGT
jgi:hypothetical protein